MSRTTRFVIAILIMAILGGISAPALADAVIDIDDHWAADAIYDLVDQGVIRPRLDGTFEPNENITRAEFAKWVVKAFNLSLSASVTFEDTADHLYKNYIGGLAKAGIIDAEAKKFRPDDNITRAEAVDIIAKVLDIDNIENLDGIKNQFKDIDKNDANYTMVMAAKNIGILAPNLKTKFAGKDRLTRAEAAYMLNAGRSLQLFAGDIATVNPQYRVVEIGGTQPKSFTIPDEAIIVRNRLPVKFEDLQKDDEIAVIADSSGDVRFIKARGLINQTDLFGRVSQLTRGLLKADQIGKIVTGDWKGLQNDLKAYAFNEIVELGASPWEAQALINQDWTTVRGLAEKRLVDTVSDRFDLSPSLVSAIANQNWDQLKSQLNQLQLSQLIVDNLNL